MPITYTLQFPKNQKGKSPEKDLPFLKTISQVFLAPDIYMFIASAGFGLKISNRNLKDFMASIFQCLRQSSHFTECLK